MEYLEQWGGGVVRVCRGPVTVEYPTDGRFAMGGRIPHGPHPDYWVAGCNCPFCMEWRKRDRAGREMLRYIGVERYRHMNVTQKRHVLAAEKYGESARRHQRDPYREVLERTGRTLRASGALPPEVVPVVAKRPTWMEVVDRDTEIIDWNIKRDRTMVKYRRRVRAWGYQACAYGLLVVPSIMVHAWQLLVVMIVSCVSAGLLTLGAAGKYNETRDGTGARPKALEIKKYEAWENQQLLEDQERESFRSTCPCPSCGYVDLHDMKEASARTPDWARVVRVCKVCGREWGQA